MVQTLTPGEFGQRLMENIPARIDVRSWRALDCMVFEIDKINDLLPLLSFLRDSPVAQFKQLVDICGVDYPERPKRFEVVYQFLTLKYNRRCRVKLAVAEGQEVPSVTNLFKSANWLEREVFDMYGIAFSEHPDMRRILTDYGFQGHPQRKDFPLTGYKQIKYDENLKKVVYEPVSLDQEFRNFDYVSPWEGTEYILPGDEKAAKGDK